MRRPTVMAGASLGMMAAAIAAMSAATPAPMPMVARRAQENDRERIERLTAAREAWRLEQERRAQERIAAAEAKRARRQARNLKNLGKGRRG